MSAHVLTTPKEAEFLLARIFSKGRKCTVSVREDKAFTPDGWLSMGVIELDTASDTAEHLLAAVRRGAFEWMLPELQTAQNELSQLLSFKGHDKEAPKLRRALDSIATIGIRAGLEHPRFDPHALESMPFRRSSTIVVDTSGAVQGGLDFIARFLHPAARIKVPAIVQMEIVNFADRFLVGRRAVKTKHADLLIDHLISQGGQRVLLRLELSADTEIERSFLLGDPLRSAFQRDSDPELSELNLSVSIRAYADRLILEAARQHQAQSSHGHKVQLLTSDQGLARMAIAEGIIPLFFKSVVASDLFGKRLTGATLDPFNGKLRETSLASVVWELAAAFGSARFQTSEDASFTISAFGEGLSWSPYQSHADLLWCDQQGVPETLKFGASKSQSTTEKSKPKDIKKVGARVKAEASEKPLASSKSSKIPIDANTTNKTDLSGALKSVALPRFNVGNLFRLVDVLDNEQSMPEEDVIKVIGTRNLEGTDNYRRFLLSANLIKVAGGIWNVEPGFQRLAIALRTENISEVLEILVNAPSFRLFSEELGKVPLGESWDPVAFSKGGTTYETLGEVTCICTPIFGEGLYSTKSNPSVEEFATIAISRFHELDQGDGLVATGAWLEELVRKDGIHPEVARRRLNDASSRKLLQRSTEGSTTEVRFDDHVIKVLRIQSGSPTVSKIHLYRGDYLIPGKSSTSLRIEGPSK